MAPQLEECPLPQEDGQIKPKHSKDLQNKITPAQENTTKAPTIEEPDATENHQTEDASHRIHSQTKLVKKNYGYYGRSNIMVQLMLDIIEYIVRTMTKHYAQVNLYQRKLQLKQKNKGRIVVVAEEDEDAHARSSSKSTSTNTSTKSKKRDDTDRLVQVREDDINKLVRFLVDHETLVQVFMISPLCVMVLYIVLVENGQLYWNGGGVLCGRI